MIKNYKEINTIQIEPYDEPRKKEFVAWLGRAFFGSDLKYKFISDYYFLYNGKIYCIKAGTMSQGRYNEPMSVH